jgi:hypothetical protein
MPGRVHQNDAPALSLASSLAAGDTAIPVNQSITGVETPISYTINSGGANEEIVTLTSKNTSTSPSQFEDVVRGCDGTADQSHSSGEVLEHEATERDLVDQGLLYSQIHKPHSGVYMFDDFRGPQGYIDGRVAPTGQTYTTRTGSSKFKIDGNGLLTPDGYGEIITFPGDATSNYTRIELTLSTSGNFNFGVVIAYTDTNNYVAVKANSTPELIQVSGGSQSTLASSNINNHTGNGAAETLVVRYGGGKVSGHMDNAAFYYGGSIDWSYGTLGLIGTKDKGQYVTGLMVANK